MVVTNRDENDMGQLCGSRNRLGVPDTVTCTLDLALVLDDENYSDGDSDVSDLTCKFLLAFSHCAFYFILCRVESASTIEFRIDPQM